MGRNQALTFCFLCLYPQVLVMAPQHLPSTRMAPRGMLLGLLLASCLTFCLSCQNSNNFALTNPEKSTHEDSDTKETRREEELDAEVLEVLNPTQEWQALQPGTSLALLLRNSELKPQMPFVPEGWKRPCSW